MSYSFAVTDRDSGERLDRFLARKLLGIFSRTVCRRLVTGGHVSPSRDPSYRLRGGQRVEVYTPNPEVIRNATASPNQPVSDAIALDILHEDNDVLVINKPAGIVVHPAPGHMRDTLVQAVARHCSSHFFFCGDRPGVVHRLDKDTSGIMVFAKNDQSLACLAEQFAAHGRDGRLERLYTALIWGTLTPRNGTIQSPIGRDRQHREKMRTGGKNARRAVTHYRVLKALEGGEVSLIECRLETGRTHQIRVHMMHMGSPILCDKIYARGYETKLRTLPEWARGAVEPLSQQALHACKLSFVHPRTHQKLTFEQRWPEPIATVARKLGFD